MAGHQRAEVGKENASRLIIPHRQESIVAWHRGCGGSALSAPRARARRRQRAWGPKEALDYFSQGFRTVQYCITARSLSCPPARVVAPSGVVQAQASLGGANGRPPLG